MEQALRALRLARLRTPPGAQEYAPSNVRVLSLTTALISVAMYSWYPVLPVVLERRGASGFGVSVVYALITLAGALPQVIGGRLADRFGRKPLVALPTFVSAVLYAIAWLSRDWQLLAAALVAMNLAFGLQTPSFVAITAESVPSTARAQAFSTFQFAVGIATLAGPALGALLIHSLTVSGLLGMTAIVTLLGGAARQLLLREVRQEMAVRAFRLRDAFAGNLRRLTLASTAFLAVGALTINGPFIALFAHNDAHLFPWEVNLLFAVGWVPAVVLSFWLGRRVSTLGSARALAIGVGGHLGLLGIWLLARGLFPMMLLLALSFLFYQMAVIAFGTLRMEQIGTERAGVALGAIGTVSGVASALGPLLGGALRSTLGAPAAFMLAGVAGAWTLLELRRMSAP